MVPDFSPVLIRSKRFLRRFDGEKFRACFRKVGEGEN